MLRGAKELSTIFEQRTAQLKAEYEEKIRVLTQERDAALAQCSEDRTQDSDIMHVAELVALRTERDNLLQGSQWQEERARWEQEHERWQEQLMKWAEEKNAIAKERRALEQQVKDLIKEKEELKERIMSMIGTAVPEDVEIAPAGGDSLGEMNADVSLCLLSRPCTPHSKGACSLRTASKMSEEAVFVL